MNGVELARAEADAVAIAALSERTAKRSLGELTRLVRALGHPGTLLLFTDADKLAKLPPVRRENGYTVLRELVDNADGGRGLLATRVVVTGGRDFFHGVRSMAALKPLATRVVIPEGAAVLPPPHRPLLFLDPPDAWGGEESPHVEPVAIGERRTAAMRAVIRASQGLPPVEAILSMSVGHEHIDATIDQLFEHSAMEGSVFALLTGAYGAGKTHLLLHLAARALVDQRPVLRLSLETLDADLGNPQRHLRRLLENAVLPLTGQPGPLDCLAAWVRSPQKLETLLYTLRTIRDEKGDAAHAADRALRNAARTTAGGAAIESFLSAQDLEGKPGGAGYRHDAYTRLLLWFELTERIEHCAGPVLLIDEAENLYKGGTSRAERRTALRSLAFYCGGTLPRACVVLAITPEMLKELRAESKELLDEIRRAAHRPRLGRRLDASPPPPARQTRRSPRPHHRPSRHPRRAHPGHPRQRPRQGEGPRVGRLRLHAVGPRPPAARHRAQDRRPPRGPLVGASAGRRVGDRGIALARHSLPPAALSR